MLLAAWVIDLSETIAFACYFSRFFLAFFPSSSSTSSSPSSSSSSSSGITTNRHVCVLLLLVASCCLRSHVFKRYLSRFRLRNVLFNVTLITVIIYSYTVSRNILMRNRLSQSSVFVE